MVHSQQELQHMKREELLQKYQNGKLQNVSNVTNVLLFVHMLSLIHI